MCLCLLRPFAVSAQDLGDPSEDEAETARFHFGPVAVTPVLDIQQVGVDTNVFNDSENRQRDFTASIGPSGRYWMRFGRLRLKGESGLAYHYFHEFSTQRSFGTENQLQLSLPLNRFTPFVKGGYDNTRRRPDYEIDARVRTKRRTAGAGLDIRAGARTVLRFEGESNDIDFDDDAVFLGSSLGEVLNRREELYGIGLHRRLTPLTTFVVSGGYQRDRFKRSPVRDADSYRVLAGFELDPFALISGTAFVGYRSFSTLDEDTPDFKGVIANATVAYVLRSTRFGFRVRRDAHYSFEISEPFYIATELMGEVTQKITSNWDMVGRVGRTTLDYQRLVSLESSERTDTEWLAGGGIGRRVGRSARIGFDVNHLRRESPLGAAREYEGWRIGGSLTYGVSQ